MHKAAAMGFIMLFLVLGAAQASASSTWTAWLHDSTHNTMILVGSDSTIQDEIALPGVMAYDAFGKNIAVSPDGRRFAYTISSSETGLRQLLVYDTTLDVTTAIYAPPRLITDSLEFKATPFIFDETGGSLAYGYSSEDQGLVRWEIITLDVLTGKYTLLSSQSPLALNSGVENDYALTPTIHLYRDRQVAFTLVKPGEEAMPEHPGYRWDTLNNTLVRDAMFRTISLDILTSTGEFIAPIYAPDFPGGIRSFGTQVPNTLQVFVPGASDLSPFFQSESAALFNPRFIQHGERILYKASPLDDIGESNQWRVIGRDGAAYGTMPQGMDLSGAASVADGFVYINDVGDKPTLYHINTRDGIFTGNPIWTGEAGQAIALTWVQDIAPAIQAFTPWAVLAPATIAVTATPSATVLETLVVGGGAVVTEVGNNLRPRNGPGTGFEILQTMRSGTFLNILEGPVTADGFTWWRMRTPEGIEGWAVEFSGADRWLDPAPVGGGGSGILGGSG